MKIRVSTGDLDGFFPYQRVRAEFGLPVKLDQHRLTRLVNKAESVDAEALHHPIAARNRTVRHLPHQHVGRFGHERDEVPEGVVRTGGLRHLVVWFRLDRMNQIRKLDGVLNEEHRDIVSHQVPIAFVGIELDRKAANIACRILGATLSRDSRKADEHRRHLACLFEGRCFGVLGQWFIAFEETMRT